MKAEPTFPTLDDLYVSCGGMVLPYPDDWEAVPAFTTDAGHRCYHHKPSGGYYYWSTDTSRMWPCRAEDGLSIDLVLARYRQRMGGGSS